MPPPSFRCPISPFILDTDPAKARARKPEYPVDFLNTCRQSYLALSDLIGGMTVIPGMSKQEAEREVSSGSQPGPCRFERIS